MLCLETDVRFIYFSSVTILLILSGVTLAFRWQCEKKNQILQFHWKTFCFPNTLVMALHMTVMSVLGSGTHQVVLQTYNSSQMSCICSKLGIFLARTVKQGRNAWPFRNFKSRSKWIMTYLVCYIFLYIEEALIADEEKKQTCCLLYRLSHTEMFKLEMSWKHWLRSFVSLWMALVYLIYFDECLYSKLHE